MQSRGTSPRPFDHVAFGDEVDVVRGGTLGARRRTNHHPVEERVGIRQIQHDSSRAPPDVRRDYQRPVYWISVPRDSYHRQVSRRFVTHDDNRQSKSVLDEGVKPYSTHHRISLSHASFARRDSGRRGQCVNAFHPGIAQIDPSPICIRDRDQDPQLGGIKRSSYSSLG